MVKQVKNMMKRIPLARRLAREIRTRMRLARLRHQISAGSAAYWDWRYKRGGTSGPGSYGRLAEFKAGVINTFVADRKINSVIDFGCGDGNQLALICVPKYIGLDVSKTAIDRCKARFANDPTKSFFLYEPFGFVDNHSLFRADMAISLDVIYHLIEDEVFHAYMRHLFSAAEQFVIIYSSDCDDISRDLQVKQRRFSAWVSLYCANWSLIKKIPNRYPYKPSADMTTTSQSNFFIYKKCDRVDSA